MASTKISDMTSAVSVADADVVPIVQSGVNKKSAWSLFKSTLKTYFDTLYQNILTAANFGDFVVGLTGKTTPVDADTIPLSDSAASDDAKKVTWANVKATLKTYNDTLYATLSSQPRSIYMDAGDQSTTSNVASDITELVFSVEANKRYFVRGHIRVGCNNTGGVKIGVTVPAGATFYNAVAGRSATTTPATVAIGAIVSSGSLSTATFIVANNAYGFIEVAGEFTIDATAGNVQFQFASGTNTQTSTVYQQGTQISVLELP